MISYFYVLDQSHYIIYSLQSIFRRIATLLQRAISCRDTHEDTVAAYELARTHRVKDKYTLDKREVSEGEGEGVLVRRVYVFRTMFIYLAHVWSLFNFMLELCLCMEFIQVYVGTMFISHF